MSSPQKAARRWRRIFLVAAIVFLLSCWLYYLATLRTLGHNPALPQAELSPLLTFFREHGGLTLLVEIVLLAICTAGLVRSERLSR